jgi:hypothetical protein
MVADGLVLVCASSEAEDEKVEIIGEICGRSRTRCRTLLRTVATNWGASVHTKLALKFHTLGEAAARVEEVFTRKQNRMASPVTTPSALAPLSS